MGAAGKKREEELLAKIESLRKDLSLRDSAINKNLQTIEEQNNKIAELEKVIE
jgi:hypothetical protein